MRTAASIKIDPASCPGPGLTSGQMVLQSPGMKEVTGWKSGRPLPSRNHICRYAVPARISLLPSATNWRGNDNDDRRRQRIAGSGRTRDRNGQPVSAVLAAGDADLRGGGA